MKAQAATPSCVQGAGFKCSLQTILKGILRKLYYFSLLRHKGNRLISLWRCAGCAFKATHYPGASFSPWPRAQVRSRTLRAASGAEKHRASREAQPARGQTQPDACAGSLAQRCLVHPRKSHFRLHL